MLIQTSQLLNKKLHSINLLNFCKQELEFAKHAYHQDDRSPTPNETMSQKDLSGYPKCAATLHAKFSKQKTLKKSVAE